MKRLLDNMDSNNNNKRIKVDVGKEIMSINLLDQPPEIIRLLAEKIEKINDKLNFLLVCKKTHSIVDTLEFWSRMLSLWFGPAQNLIENFGLTSDTLMYSASLINSSGFYQHSFQYYMTEKKIMSDVVKPKFIFHSYLVSLYATVERGYHFKHLLENYKKKWEPGRLLHLYVVPKNQLEQYPKWKFQFTAFGQEWNGYAILTPNGEWIVSPFAITTQQIMQCFDLLRSYAVSHNIDFASRFRKSYGSDKEWEKSLNRDLWSRLCSRRGYLNCLWNYNQAPQQLQIPDSATLFYFYISDEEVLFIAFPANGDPPEQLLVVSRKEWSE